MSPEPEVLALVDTALTDVALRKSALEVAGYVWRPRLAGGRELPETGSSDR